MIIVTMYGKADCHLCDQARLWLAEIHESLPHQLVYIDIDADKLLQRKYGLEIPVLEIGPYHLKTPFTIQDLRITMQAERDRQRQLQSLAQNPSAYLNITSSITLADRFSYWLSKHYLGVVNGLVLLYLSLPFIAPILLHEGLEPVGLFIYRAYGIVCHQLAFRSWFLFGEQPFYPREVAGIAGMSSFEQVTGINAVDILSARDFLGNQFLGYKVALCERDVAIYEGILLFGVIFSLTGRRFKSVSWLTWILIGLVPIGIDGLSQLLSQPPYSLLMPDNLIPFRESTPILRTVTGGLFGFVTAWFGIPMVEESMAETRRFMRSRFNATKSYD